jgi:serine/threonine protein kinase
VTDDPRVGTELAGYRIESLLGLGGMSVVYAAEDLRLKRRVALKLLSATLAGDESFRRRFLRESELAASIDHPNIVPIYEAGTTEDLLYIAMRYVEGGDLKERLRRSRLDPADATGILAQVASALDAAHSRGLVHRDVKPSNVLLDTGARPDGSDHVYLADFGLTRQVSDRTGAGDGHLLGTIDYVAPEQIAGEEVDGRADVYSLAACSTSAWSGSRRSSVTPSSRSCSHISTWMRRLRAPLGRSCLLRSTPWSRGRWRRSRGSAMRAAGSSPGPRSRSGSTRQAAGWSTPPLAPPPAEAT